MTAAKMILHDWQRGKIPFFVPPPKLNEVSEAEEEPNVNGIDVDEFGSFCLSLLIPEGRSLVG